MMGQLKRHDAPWQLVCDAFGVPTSHQMQTVAKASLTKDYRAHLLAFSQDGKVRSTDISALDPDSDDERVAGWEGSPPIARALEMRSEQR